MGAQQSHQARRTSTSSSGTTKRGDHSHIPKEQQSKESTASSSNSTDDEIESFNLSSNATAIRRNGLAMHRTANKISNSQQRISTYSTTSSSSDHSSLESTLFSLASTTTSNSIGTTPPSSFPSCHSSSTKHHHHGHEGIINNNAYGNVRRYTASRPNKIVDIFMSRVSTTSSHGFNTASLPLDVDYAFNTLTTLAKTDCAAHVPLAICYDYGFTPNRQQDLQKALMWYKRAVAGSSDDTQKTMIAFAHYRIGVILSSLSSSSRRHNQKQKHVKNEASNAATAAIEHYRIAATQGNAMGQYALGMWYLKQQEDLVHARKWLMASANQGCDMGQEALGSLLIDCSKDNEHSEKQQGIHYIRLAADQVT